MMENTEKVTVFGLLCVTGILSLVIGVFIGMATVETPICGACICHALEEPVHVENETVRKYTTIYERPTLKECVNLIDNKILEVKQIQTASEVWQK